MKSIHENKSGYVVITEQSAPYSKPAGIHYGSDLVLFEYVSEAATHGIATTNDTNFYIGCIKEGYLVNMLSSGTNSEACSISYIAKEIGVL